MFFSLQWHILTVLHNTVDCNMTKTLAMLQCCRFGTLLGGIRSRLFKAFGSWSVFKFFLSVYKFRRPFYNFILPLMQGGIRIRLKRKENVKTSLCKVIGQPLGGHPASGRPFQPAGGLFSLLEAISVEKLTFDLMPCAGRSGRQENRTAAQRTRTTPTVLLSVLER